MKTCVFCKTRYRKGGEITFHKFPSNATKKLWLKNMKLGDWSPKLNDYLCSQHFTDDCFVKQLSRTTLKSGSEPTLFSHSSSPLFLERVKKSENKILDEKSGEIKLEASSERNDNQETTLQDNKDTNASEPQEISKTITQSYEENINYIPTRVIINNINHDHSYKNSNSILTTKTEERLKKSLKISQNRVKVLSQHVVRLQKNVFILKKVITDLKSKVRRKYNFKQAEARRLDKLVAQFINRHKKTIESKN